MGRGTLFVCKVEAQGRGFSIVGQPAPPAAGIGGSSVTSACSFQLAYAGPRGVNAEGVLLVHSNDPAQPLLQIPLRALAAGRAEFQYEPELLEIIVANTPRGTYEEESFEAVRDCQAPGLHRRAS